MDSGRTHSKNQLLHVDIYVDELEPRTGIFNLLSRLRPHWKTQDIQMKVWQHLGMLVWIKDSWS